MTAGTTLYTPLKGHDSAVTSVAFGLGPDGKSVLASGSTDNSIKLWDVASGKELRTLAGHTGPVRSVAFAPSGQIQNLASASDDKTVRLWNGISGKEISISPLSGHTGPVISVAFNPNGKLVASGSADATIRLWRVSDGVLLQTLTVSTAVRSVAFNSSGTLLASGDDDGVVSLWGIR